MKEVIRSLGQDSSSEERSETGLETKRSTMHSEVHPKRGELQSAENRINLCDVKKKNL